MWIWSYYGYWLRMLWWLYERTKHKRKTMLLYIKRFWQKIKRRLSNLLEVLGYEGLMLIGCKWLIKKYIEEDTEEKGLGYLFREISKQEFFSLSKKLSEKELDIALKIFFQQSNFKQSLLFQLFRGYK